MQETTREHMVDNMLLMLDNKMTMEEMLDLQDRLVMRVKGSIWKKMRAGEKINEDDDRQLRKALISQLPKGMYVSLKECADMFQVGEVDE